TDYPQSAELAHDAAGVAGRDDARRHVAHHDSPGAHDRTGADGDARAHDDAPAQPGAVLDPDGGAPLDAGTSLHGVARVVSGEQLYARTDLHVVTEHDGDDVEDHQVEVDEGPPPDRDVGAVVAAQRRVDVRPLTDRAEQGAQQLGPPPAVGLVVEGAQQ